MAIAEIKVFEAVLAHLRHSDVIVPVPEAHRIPQPVAIAFALAYLILHKDAFTAQPHTHNSKCAYPLLCDKGL